ncbi:hypothetical protein ABIB83_001264 [Bradyrhizobium sp. I1.8.5]|uniref:DUF6894 family protein n=1 Tax=Bradyrhizobium sp. I1.8.5 TaxID=3156365 RepID=UPI0033926769
MSTVIFANLGGRLSAHPQRGCGFADFLQPGHEDEVRMSTLVSALQDAAASREAWPDALKALTEAAGVAGAALIISNKSTGNVEDACFFGLSAEFKSDYTRYYAALDPYSPLLDASWKTLSECFADPVLRRSEWYNDFVLACGVRDILGARLVETHDYRIIFGIHKQIGRSFPARLDSLIELVTDPLRRAAEHNVEHLRSTIGTRHEPATELSADSRRFYFHIDNGTWYADEAGSVHSTPDQAAAHALTIARELAQDDSWHGSSVLVTDARGRPIARVRIG